MRWSYYSVNALISIVVPDLALLALGSGPYLAKVGGVAGEDWFALVPECSKHLSLPD